MEQPDSELAAEMLAYLIFVANEEDAPISLPEVPCTLAMFALCMELFIQGIYIAMRRASVPLSAGGFSLCDVREEWFDEVCRAMKATGIRCKMTAEALEEATGGGEDFVSCNLLDILNGRKDLPLSEYVLISKNASNEYRLRFEPFHFLGSGAGGCGGRPNFFQG